MNQRLGINGSRKEADLVPGSKEFITRFKKIKLKNNFFK